LIPVYLIALFDSADQLNALARRWASALAAEPLLVTEYVLVEAVNYFSKRAVRPRAIDIVDGVRLDDAHEFVPATSSLFDEGVALYRASNDKDWSLTDCISFQVMRQRNVTRALAYDKHFVQAGFVALLRQEPPTR